MFNGPRYTMFNGPRYRDVGFDMLIPVSYKFHHQMKGGFIDVAVPADANIIFKADIIH